MPRLIRVFAWRTGHFVGFVVQRLILKQGVNTFVFSVGLNIISSNDHQKQYMSGLATSENINFGVY